MIFCRMNQTKLCRCFYDYSDSGSWRDGMFKLRGQATVEAAAVSSKELSGPRRNGSLTWNS